MIKIEKTTKFKKKPPQHQLGFGRVFTDHMFIMEYDSAHGWHNPRVQPYQNFSLDPAALCFHYAQGLFEGMKAYSTKEEEILLFRPKQNLKRMQEGCRRMSIPPFDEKLLFKGLIELLKLEKDWIPKGKGTSVYIRPTIVATEAALGVRPSNKYYLYIILSPVGNYYEEGFKPLKIYVEDDFVRAAPGGTGAIKAVGNYGTTLLASHEAKERGYAQVLWLDAKKRRYIEEIGAMNIFFVIDNEVVTPPLSDTILPGITRDSVIEILKDWNQPVTERSVTINEIVESCQSGRLTEVFGTGTAAVISPVGLLNYKDKDYIINDNKVGSITKKLYDHLLKLQHGEITDKHKWIHRVKC